MQLSTIIRENIEKCRLLFRFPTVASLMISACHWFTKNQAMFFKAKTLQASLLHVPGRLPSRPWSVIRCARGRRDKENIILARTTGTFPCTEHQKHTGQIATRETSSSRTMLQTPTLCRGYAKLPTSEEGGRCNSILIVRVGFWIDPARAAEEASGGGPLTSEKLRDGPSQGRQLLGLGSR